MSILTTEYDLTKSLQLLLVMPGSCAWVAVVQFLFLTGPTESCELSEIRWKFPV
ncbi:uncharacterized protein P174DRAFT_437884 [Aspergillus novofumigatus IBT 16806]|uniref:Uncharacterized protein n=1 Tax=Aspergillus novofumigatus (strain IBT 16806) TaxID=1392255 RepID=A0A2I1CP85_ASPN1|nr:uncharacterized protein P174DRAFT_437884 [Aspergillus novofumigatus IBT 16806]PKX99426.1 hypothetical protein P174DRAFT_437884 [Aspergillus novofumigatus IBT 16806]